MATPATSQVVPATSGTPAAAQIQVQPVIKKASLRTKALTESEKKVKAAYLQQGKLPPSGMLVTIPKGTPLYHASPILGSFNPEKIRLNENKKITFAWFSTDIEHSKAELGRCFSYKPGTTKVGYIHYFIAKEPITFIRTIHESEASDEKEMQGRFCGKFDGVMYIMRQFEGRTSGEGNLANREMYFIYGICNLDKYIRWIGQYQCIARGQFSGLLRTGIYTELRKRQKSEDVSVIDQPEEESEEESDEEENTNAQ